MDGVNGGGIDGISGTADAVSSAPSCSGTSAEAGGGSRDIRIFAFWDCVASKKRQGVLRDCRSLLAFLALTLAFGLGGGGGLWRRGFLLRGLQFIWGEGDSVVLRVESERPAEKSALHTQVGCIACVSVKKFGKEKWAHRLGGCSADALRIWRTCQLALTSDLECI